jgi:hypothetical protein
MGVSVKAEWIEHYRAERQRREEAERQRGRKIERGLLAAYAITSVAAAALIYASIQ